MGKLLKTAGYVVLAIATGWLVFFYSPVKPPVDDGKIHIEYWHLTGAKEQYPFIVEEFNKSQDSIVVDPVAIPWMEHEKKVLTAILSGDPPDVISQLNPLPQWASRLALLPLDDYIEQDNFDTTVFFPALWKEMKWNTHTYGLPSRTASYAMYINNRIFREVGLDPTNPPKSWEDVQALSRSLVKYDENGRLTRMGFIPEYGALPGHGDVPTVMLLAWQMGTQVLSDDGMSVSMTNDAMHRSLRWVVDFYDDYDVDEVAAFIAGFGYADQHAFVAEKVAMMMLADTYIEFIEQYGPELDYTVCEIPSFEGSPSASASGSWWLGIPRGSKHADAAWQFMKFAVRKDNLLAEALALDESLFPANRLAAHDPYYTQDSTMAIFVRQMEVAHSPAVVPLVHAVFWREFLGARERAVKRLQSPLEALQQAENQIQLELNKAAEYDRYVRSQGKY